MPKMRQNTFVGRAPPGPAGEHKLSPKCPGCNQGGSTSKGGGDISSDWPQDGTTSLKYKAQREHRVPNSSKIF